MAVNEDDLLIPVGDGHGDAIPAADLLRECENVGRHFQEATQRLSLSERNERWVHGEQFSDEDLDREDTHTVGWDGDLVRENRNLLRSFWLTWTARALEELPITMVYPQDAGGIDATLARIANALLDYVDQRNSMTAMWQQQVGNAQLHSVAGFKVCYDPTRSVYGSQTPGDIIVDPHTIFDYWTDGADNDEQTSWVCFRRWVSRDEAISIAAGAGVAVDDIVSGGSRLLVNPRTLNRDAEGKVAITELWWRPEGETGRFPDGLYCSFVGDTAIDVQPFPYAHGECPLTVIKIMGRRGSPYGSTHVDDAISPQRLFNKFVSVQARRAEEFQDTYLVALTSLVEKITQGNKILGVGSVEEVQNAMAFFNPPGPSDLLQAETDKARENIGDMFGLNESLMGSQDIVGRGPAGKTVSYYKWLQGQKFGEVIKSIHAAMVRMSRQTILLMQEFAPDDLLLSIIGRDRVVDLEIFRNADLRSIDTALKLEPAAGASRLRAAQAEAAQLAAAEGRMDPARAAEIQRTGLDATGHEDAMASSLQNLVRVALSGQPVQPDQTVDPAFAVSELERLHSAYRSFPNAEIILEIAEWYRTQAQQAAAGAAAQQAPGAVPGGTMAPSGVQQGPPVE